MDTITRSMLLKGETGLALTGVSTGEPDELASTNNAGTFVDVLMKTDEKEDGEVWSFPQGQLCTDGSVRPVPDALTPLRLECFSKLIPLNLATRTEIVPNTMIDTFLVSGSCLIVPFAQVTITDWCRLLVSAFAITPIARQAGKLMENISLRTGEEWRAASPRLVWYVRWTDVHHTHVRSFYRMRIIYCLGSPA